MRAADRLVITIAAAICRAWIRSRARHLLRRVIRWRTAYLLECADADAHALVLLRDVEIPLAFRALAEEKHALLRQWEAVADGAPPPCPAPDPLPRTAAVSPWSRNEYALPGRLYTQRTSQQ